MKPLLPPRRSVRAFTLVELMIVVALLAIVLTLAAPSFRDMIEMQRLRGTNAELVTDVQLARSEAASRGEVVAIAFNPNAAGGTCYTVQTWPDSVPPPQLGGVACDCAQPAGSRCVAPMREIRTVVVASNTRVRVEPVAATPPPPDPSTAAVETVLFNPATGGIQAYANAPGGGGMTEVNQAWAETSLQRAGTPPKLRTMVGRTGRPSVCSPGGLVSGVTPC